MAISAFFDPVDAESGARAPRRILHFETSGRGRSGEESEVLVHNASTTGLLLETTASLDEGDRIEIDLPHAGPTTAEVVWRSGKLHGCKFETPITQGALSAAELRSVAGAPPGEQSPQDAPTASFGMRLKQLRKARGLTLANVADALSVSKPTVWAWEHGKARPVDSRMEGIAEVLGVDQEAIIPTAGQLVPREVIDRCRSQLAEAAGIPPESVRILIEL